MVTIEQVKEMTKKSELEKVYNEVHKKGRAVDFAKISADDLKAKIIKMLSPKVSKPNAEKKINPLDKRMYAAFSVKKLNEIKEKIVAVIDEVVAEKSQTKEEKKKKEIQLKINKMEKELEKLKAKV